MFVEVFGNTNRGSSDFQNDDSLKNLPINFILKWHVIGKTFVLSTRIRIKLQIKYQHIRGILVVH